MAQTRVTAKLPAVVAIALSFYFLSGLWNAADGVLALSGGNDLAYVTVRAALGAASSVFSYAAWKRRRWGYIGLLLVEAWVIFTRVRLAQSFAWRDALSNIEAVLDVAILLPLVVHYRLWARRSELPPPADAT